MSWLGWAFFIIMEFFNQLLTSYSLLKKRKLHVVMDEESAALSFSKIEKISQTGTERGKIALAAIEKANSEIEQIKANPENYGVEKSGASPGSAPAEVKPTGDGAEGQEPKLEFQIIYQRKATVGKNGNTEILIAKKVGGQILPAGDFERFNWVRNDLAVLYFQQGIGGEVAAGGEPLTPEAQELYSRDKVSELVNLNSEDSTLGSDIISELSDMYQTCISIGRESLFSTKQTSIPYKVYQSLLGDKYQVATEDEALTGDLSKYQRPNPEAVLGSLQNLNKVLKLYIKSNSTERLTQDEYQFIKDNINRVSWKGRRSEQFRVFIKSDDPEGLGLSFDWDSRGQATELQDVLNKLQENLEKQGVDGDLEYDGLNYTDITDQVSKGGLGYVIGDVAEDAGLIVSLLQQRNKKANDKAAALFKSLHEKHGGKLEAAFGVAEGSQTGHLIGTEETEVLGIDVNQLSNSFGSSKAGEVFRRLVPTLVRAVASDLQRMKPDFVARVGGSRAGTGGDKTDQVLFYKTQEQADAAAKLAGSKPKVAKLKDLLSKDELKKTVDAYGKAVDPNKEYHYIDDSLKCTNDSSVTNLGTGAGPLSIARGFRDEKDTWSQGLTDTLFNSLGKDWKAENPDIRDQVSANFEQIENDIKSLNSIFGQGSRTVKPADAQRNFLAALTDGALQSLGLTSENRGKLQTLMKKSMKGDNAIRSFRRNLEQSIIAKRIEQGSASGDVSWRATGALMMMRGCYDTSEGSKVVVNYLTGDHFRYNGNKSMMKDFKNFINTGEGWSSTSEGKLGEGSSFRIGGYKCTFTHSKQTGVVGTKFEGKVDQSSKVSSEEPQEDSIEYSPTELMNKLLEVQQLIFSSLIKE